MNNYYDTLGIEETATIEQIKKAYKTAAKEHHPDRGGDEEKFKEIQQAYETLIDETKRHLYDAGIKDTGKYSSEVLRLFVDVLLPELVDNIRSGHTMKNVLLHHIEIQKAHLEQQKDGLVWTKDSVQKVLAQMNKENATGIHRAIINNYEQKVEELNDDIQSVWNKIEILAASKNIAEKLFI